MVINVWGSRGPRRGAEAAVPADGYAQVKDQRVQLLGTSTRDEEARSLAFVKRFGLASASLVHDGLLRARLAGSPPAPGVPTTLIVDPQGRVAARTVSTVCYQRLLSLIEVVPAADGQSASPSLT